MYVTLFMKYEPIFLLFIFLLKQNRNQKVHRSIQIKEKQNY